LLSEIDVSQESWLSIKRIPFSPGFHCKIGKFVTLGERILTGDKKRNIWDKK
jgi:hypothetical protein